MTRLILAGVLVFNSQAAPPTADLLNETFNNATNYDDATWTETVASGGVNDPNETAACPTGTGFGGECYESLCAASNRKAYIYNDLGAAQGGPVYTVLYLYLTGFASWSSTEGVIIMGATTTAVAPTSTSQFQGTLIYDLDGILGGETTCAAPPCFRLLLRMREVGNTLARSPEVSLNSIHQIKFKVDNGGQGEVWLDGTRYILTTLNNEADTQFIWAGQPDFSIGSQTIYFDNVKTSTTGYVE
jgi:hypothetical protein